jgi:hypothetical protein
LKFPHYTPNVRTFMEHLVVGLECFDLDLLDYNPLEVEHKKHGRGVTFSQIIGGRKNNEGRYHVIVSERGLILPNGGSLPYSNEQQPTMVMLLLLSAMVDQRPLEFEPCKSCKGEE